MAGGTHVFDMIKRLRDNDNLRKNDYFKKTRELYRKTSTSINLDYRKATDIERQEIRRKVIESRKRETVKASMVLALSLIVTLLLILFVLNIL